MVTKTISVALLLHPGVGLELTEYDNPSICFLFGFTSIVHAFICSRIDYCNSLFVGLPKVRLSPLQSVINAAAGLIARLPRFSHISTFMFEQLHWLPLTARIQLKVLADLT